MPELPEVETVVRQLANALPGHRVRELEVFHSDLVHGPPADFRKALLGSAMESVTRRGKNILIALSGSSLLRVNLGMTGQLLFQPSPMGSEEPPGENEPHHVALIFTLEPESFLLYADARRFGSLRRFTRSEWERESARLGPEPLDPRFTPGEFHRRLSLSRSPVRSWLLDQTRIAGIGNIYAAEALFRAGIHPKRPARSVASLESERLLEAVRDVLADAIRARGTTLRDYRTASGERGGFSPSLQAYDREGKPCPRCNTPIERIVFANRSAFFCPTCQPGE